MPLPVDVRELMRSGTRLVEERERPVRVAVFVEVDADEALIAAVQDALRPMTSAASLQISLAEPGKQVSLAPATDVVIAIAGRGGAALKGALDAPRRELVPVVTLALGDEVNAESLGWALAQPASDLIVAPEAAEVVQRLGAWLTGALSVKRLALAHNFAFMRRAVAADAVKTTAWQNGLVGAVSLIPGADMPIMTANQAKMLLQIAAAYGEPLGVDRIKELAVVVGGGFLLRALARQALVAVPVLGWAVKGGIGYTGTVAMGKAAIAYFEDGADLSQVTARLREMRDRAASRLPRRQAVAALPAASQLALPVEEDGRAGA